MTSPTHSRERHPRLLAHLARLGLGLGLVGLTGLAPAAGPPSQRPTDHGTMPLGTTNRPSRSSRASAAPALAAPALDATVHLPLTLAGRPTSLAPVAEGIWRSIVAFTEAHPPQDVYPGYDEPPSPEAALRSVEAACHDFPAFEQHYQGQSHTRGCYVWVPEYLGVMHAAAARRLRTHPGDEPLLGMGREIHLAWAEAYLTASVSAFSAMVNAPHSETSGFRDTRIAVWQNPQRIVETVILAELLRQEGLHGDMGMRAAVVSAIAAVAWKAEWYDTGVHPSHDVTLVTATAGPEDPAIWLLGRIPIVSTVPYTFTWNADKGNTPAEEVMWMGAGAMLAAQVAGDVLAPEEIEDLAAAGRHWVDFAWTFDRPDPLHGTPIRTLNAETEGGPYGQRRLWIENHSDDTPAVPYLGWVGLYLGSALLASPEGHQQPWPALIADEAHWRTIVASAEATLHAPDGTFLVDWTPGGGLGFQVGHLPEWTTECGQLWLGHHYVRYDGRAGGPAHFVSEIGHPGGLDLLAAGWPLARIAAARGDWGTWRRWTERMARVAEEYASNPPEPRTAECGVAPYVSHNPGYHWGRMLSMLTLPWLGASGFEVMPWPSGTNANLTMP